MTYRSALAADRPNQAQAQASHATRLATSHKPSARVAFALGSILVALTSLPVRSASADTVNPTAQTKAGSATLYVNPARGNDAGSGATASAPLKTISRALSLAGPGTIVQLAPGTYSVESGESFPLRVPPEVSVVGNAATRGEGVTVVGGGFFISPSFARQNVGFVFLNGGRLSGITATNPNSRGSGVWVEDGQPVLSSNTFTRNAREGVFVTGQSAPLVENNVFQRNTGNGISLTRSNRAIVRSNLFQATGYALAIGGSSAPQIQNNEIIENRDGVLISDSARPVLRNNTISRNRNDGAVVIANAQPDFGTPASPGRNHIVQNNRYAIYNATRSGAPIMASGNDLDPQKIRGSFTLATVPGQFPAIAQLVP